MIRPDYCVCLLIVINGIRTLTKHGIHPMFMACVFILINYFLITHSLTTLPYLHVFTNKLTKFSSKKLLFFKWVTICVWHSFLQAHMQGRAQYGAFWHPPPLLEHHVLPFFNAIPSANSRRAPDMGYLRILFCFKVSNMGNLSNLSVDGGCTRL